MDVIIKTTFIINIIDNIINLKYKTNFFKQLTIWNIISNILDPHIGFNIINSINIFIIFHSFFILEPNLYYDIPIKNNITVLNFHIINIILHILPLLYSIYILINYNININIFDVLYNYLYIIIWLIYNKFNNIYSIKYINCIKFLIFIVFFNILLAIIF
jgi:hypothetical protein